VVGRHCIGVDPFYLAQKAQEYGYHPEIILAGRRLNDSMGKYVATEVVKLMIKRGTPVKGAKLVTPDIRERSETYIVGGINPGLTSGVLMLGITFKENCLPATAFAKEGLPAVVIAKEDSDIRNTKAIDIYPVKSLWELFHRGEQRTA